MGQRGQRPDRGFPYRDFDRFDPPIKRDEYDSRFRRAYQAQDDFRDRRAYQARDDFRDRRPPWGSDRLDAREWDRGQGYEAPRDDSRPPWYDQEREYGGERGYGGVRDYGGERNYGRPRDFDRERAYSRRSYEQGPEPFGSYPQARSDFDRAYTEREDFHERRAERRIGEAETVHPDDRWRRPSSPRWEGERDEGRWRPGPGPSERPPDWPPRRR
jgi:hypothetical protein